LELPDNSTIFHKEDGMSLEKNSIYRIIKRLIKKAEVNPNISPHSFRRSYATYQDKAGVEVKVISEAMGHANVKITESYILPCLKIKEHLKKYPSNLSNLK
jgi:integrase/recombinase XerD